jgi:hypothetical protein
LVKDFLEGTRAMAGPSKTDGLPSVEELRRHRLILAAIAVGLSATAVVAYVFPPTEYSFYPRCYFHELTGCHCPGCGATRCFGALLHGNLAQAAAYNVLLLVCLPYIALLVANGFWYALRGRPAISVKLPDWVFRVAVVVMFLFWIVRNLPFAPFTYLAPHAL